MFPIPFPFPNTPTFVGLPNFACLFVFKLPCRLFSCLVYAAGIVSPAFDRCSIDATTQ